MVSRMSSIDTFPVPSGTATSTVVGAWTLVSDGVACGAGAVWPGVALGMTVSGMVASGMAMQFGSRVLARAVVALRNITTMLAVPASRSRGMNRPGSDGGLFYWFPTPVGAACWAA